MLIYPEFRYLYKGVTPTVLKERAGLDMEPIVAKQTASPYVDLYDVKARIERMYSGEEAVIKNRIAIAQMVVDNYQLLRANKDEVDEAIGKTVDSYRYSGL